LALGLYSGDVEVYSLPFMEDDPNKKIQIISLVHEYPTLEIHNSYYKVKLQHLKK